MGLLTLNHYQLWRINVGLAFFSFMTTHNFISVLMFLRLLASLLNSGIYLLFPQAIPFSSLLFQTCIRIPAFYIWNSLIPKVTILPVVFKNIFYVLLLCSYGVCMHMDPGGPQWWWGWQLWESVLSFCVFWGLKSAPQAYTARASTSWAVLLVPHALFSQTREWKPLIPALYCNGTFFVCAS